MECSICCSNFNKTINKKISCINCKNDVCKKCVIIWLNERSSITCPCCNTIWDWKFSYNNIGSSFIEKYKIVQKQVLLNLEKSYIPETQIFLEIKEKAKNSQLEWQKYVKIYDKYKWMNKKDILQDQFIKDNYEIFGDKPSKKFVKDYYKNIENEKYRIYTIYIRAFVMADLQALNALNDEETVLKIRKINPVCPCPVSDCKGYIKSNNFKCGVCDTSICKNCHILINDENINSHTCDKKDIESIKLITKDTKPCPKCGTRIHKYEGCDQAYCTQCRTAFSYKTGEIEKGRIHNPHHYEYLRAQYNGNIPREPGDIPFHDCDDHLPEFIESNYKGSSYIMTEKIKLLNCIKKYHICLQKFRHNEYVVRNIETYENHVFKTNYEDRMKYMNNKMTEEEFVKIIYKNFKQNIFRKEFKNELISFLEISKSVLKEISENIKKINTNFSMDSINEYMKINSNSLNEYIETQYDNDIKNVNDKFYFLLSYNEYVNKNMIELHSIFKQKGDYRRIFFLDSCDIHK